MNEVEGIFLFSRQVRYVAHVANIFNKVTQRLAFMDDESRHTWDTQKV